MAALCLSLGGGCYTGTMVDAAAHDSDDGGGAEETADDSDGGGDTDDAAPVLECEPGRVGLRRLNRREWGNTLHDLLGVDPSVVDGLPQDPFKGGFDNNASALGMTPELLDRYLGVAEVAVTEALADNQQTLITCDPATVEFADPCVAETLVGFAERAYRRPLTDEELQALESFFSGLIVENTGTSTFAGAASATFQGLLLTPQALHRNYVPPTADPNVALDQYALASRLSYFLWESTPDRLLLDAAAAAELTTEEQLTSQVRRLLADDKASAFVHTFTTQWLRINSLPLHLFDPEEFPDMDAELLTAMQAESVALVDHVLRQDRPVQELLTANYTFVGQRLAEHYGIDGVTGETAQRVELPSVRQGLLTHASVLVGTSHPDRTSIPLRGMWVMEAVMCLPPPPPPPDNVGTNDDDTGEPKTQRERLDAHRAKPECNACHSVMDNLGFGLENYDATGVWRELDNGQAVDASGVLPDGRTFEGGPQLAALIAQDDTISRCVARNALAFALGRLLTPKDACAVDNLSAQIEADNLSAAELIARLVVSETFRFEGTQEESP